MIKKRQLLHTSGIPNVNGDVFDRDEVLKAFEKHQNKGFIWVTPYPYIPNIDMCVDVERIAAKVPYDTIEFCDNGEIYGDVHFLGTPMGKIMQTVQTEVSDLKYGLISVGKVHLIDEVRHFKCEKLINIGIDSQPNIPKQQPTTEHTAVDVVNDVLGHIDKLLK